MSIANPQAANNAVKALTNKKAVTKQQKVQEATTAERTKREILDAVKSQTVTVRVYGSPIGMTRLDGDEEDWIQDQIGGFSDVDEADDLDEGEYEKYRRARERIVEMLAENAVEDVYDREFWKQLPSETRFSAMRDLMQGGQEARESSGFREK